MMETVKESQITVVDNVDYLRATKGEDSVNISISQARSVFKDLLSIPISDANKLSAGEWAYINSAIDNYPFDTGYLMGLGSGDQYIQFAINESGSQCRIRIYIYGRWSNWRSINLT